MIYTVHYFTSTGKYEFETLSFLHVTCSNFFKNLKMAKLAGCDCVCVIATNDFSARIFTKLGMEKMETWVYKDIKNEEGVNYFDKVQFETVSSWVKKL